MTQDMQEVAVIGAGAFVECSQDILTDFGARSANSA